MLDTKRILSLAAALLLLVGVGACTDDPSVTSNSVDNNSTNNRPDDPQDPPENATLVHVDNNDCSQQEPNCFVDLTYTSGRDFKAKLLGPDGNPAPDVAIQFALEDTEDTGSTLRTATAFTDEDGVASARVIAGPADSGGGTFKLSAATENGDVSPITWLVTVQSKGAASYRVSFDHTGTAQLKNIDVQLYGTHDDGSPITCADIAEDLQRERDDDPNTLPSLTAQTVKSTQVGHGQDLSAAAVAFEGLEDGSSWTVAANAKSFEHSDVEAAWGCNDDRETIENGKSVEVVVDLRDHIPYVAGRYKVTHEFDLGKCGENSLLPGNVCTIAQIIGSLASDPALAILGCPADADDQYCPEGGQTGLVGLILDFFPESVRGDIESVINDATLNEIARSALRDVINQWIEDNAPSWVSNTQQVIGSIYDTLRQLRVEGVIEIESQPTCGTPDDPNACVEDGEVIGVIPDGEGYQQWTTFIVHWPHGIDQLDGINCDNETCRFGTELLGSNFQVIEGNFSGRVLSSNEIRINQHSLNFNYGALLVAILEKLIFPSIFGPDVTSISGAIEQIVDCESVSDNSTVVSVCKSLINQASSSLRDYAIEELALDGSDTFLIGTPEGEPCTIHQPDTYAGDWPGKPTPYIDRFGKNEDGMKCKWKVRINFSQDYQPEVEGTFFGTRDDFGN